MEKSDETSPDKSEKVDDEEKGQAGETIYEDGKEAESLNLTKDSGCPEVEDESEEQSLKQMYDAEPINANIFADAEVYVNPAIVEFLSEGFVKKFIPSLENARQTMDQVKSSQNVLIETVQQEVTKFTECKAFGDLEQTMARAKLYHSKLIRLRKEMTNLHEKSGKLKKRAVRLQQQKQKEELDRAHNLEKEFEKERMLTARVASSPD